jgi:hypothetical protein
MHISSIQLPNGNFVSGGAYRVVPAEKYGGSLELIWRLSIPRGDGQPRQVLDHSVPISCIVANGE